ncbi:ferrous iron transport protein A [Vagococcus sp. DIV0080]|uniref:Ferrous iron transport protein A n=1 Tax=Candidatus Vagococcus giribetii TaxID=2230876 RepID=A0ABS3HQJ6_9ENTE|nr:ferrous iron transport protein A [Vagococcus sp. DIV0080]MBO0476023.1 ferrous iron transport protein A [Vagococcus sp. DIV0080]
MAVLVDGEMNHEYLFMGFSGNSSYEKELTQLGLVSGTTIEILSRKDQSQLVIHFSGTTLGIDEAVAKHILIEHKDSGEKRSQTVSLNTLKPGEVGTISHITGQNILKRRLMDMGMTQGTPIKLVKVAPLGDPMELKIRGYQLSIRKSDAELIFIERG